MKIANLIMKRAEALVLPMIQRLNGEYAWWSGFEWDEVPQDISEEEVESQRKQEVENVRRNLRPYMASWLACECNYRLWWDYYLYLLRTKDFEISVNMFIIKSCLQNFS